MDNIGLIISLVIIAILAITLLVGLKRGLVKMLQGLIASVAALAIAVFLVTPLSSFVIGNTQLDEMLSGALEAPLSSEIPNASTSVLYFDLNGDGIMELAVDMGDGPKPFADVFKGTALSPFAGVFQPIVAKVADPTGAKSITLLEALITAINAVVFSVLAFIISWIVARLVLTLILKLLESMASKIYIVHFLDKIIGGVLGLAFGVFSVFVIFAIIQFVSNFEFMNPVMEVLNKSQISKFILENNFIYNLIDSSFNLNGIIASLNSVFAK